MVHKDLFVEEDHNFVQTPPLLAFDIGTGSPPSLDQDIWVSCDQARVRYTIRGIYFENEHFTERVVTGTRMVWFHDVMAIYKWHPTY